MKSGIVIFLMDFVNYNVHYEILRKYEVSHENLSEKCN